MKPYEKPPQKYQLDEEPQAPLSFWKQYRIVKIIERKVQKYLHDLNYQGYSLGIRIGYAIYPNEDTENPEKHFVSFGYIGEDDKKEDAWLVHYKNSVSDINPPETDNPLTDPFIDELYTETANYIRANISSEVQIFTVLLETAVSGSVKKKGRDCRRPRPNECGAGCNGRRILRQRNDGTWFCTHQACQ